MQSGQRVFVTGGTGYMGSRLISLLQQRGHSVVALARTGSEACARGELRLEVSGAGTQLAAIRITPATEPPSRDRTSISPDPQMQVCHRLAGDTGTPNVFGNLRSDHE